MANNKKKGTRSPLTARQHVAAANLVAKSFQASSGDTTEVTWLVLLRHGATDLNVAKRVAGMMAGPYGAVLNAEARELAAACSLEMAVVERVTGAFKNALVSPLIRAQETAELMLSALKVAPKLSLVDGLKERGMGGLILLPKEYCPQYFVQVDAMPPFEGGVSDEHPESFRMFYNRIRDTFSESITPALRQGNLLVVSHQYTSAALQACLFGWSPEEALDIGSKIPNAAPIVIALHKTTLRPVITGVCVLRNT